MEFFNHNTAGDHNTSALSLLDILKSDLSHVYYNAFTGAGKTSEAIEIMVNALTNPNYPHNILYCTLRKQEIVEVLIGIKRRLNPKNADRIIADWLFVKFTKDDTEEILSTIESSATWNKYEKNWAKKLLSKEDATITEKIRYSESQKAFAKSRVKITTHSSLAYLPINEKEGKSVNSLNLTLIIDELPIGVIKPDGAKVKNDDYDSEINVKDSNSNAEFIKNSRMEAQKIAALFKRKLVGDVNWLYFCPAKQFKQVIIMSASAGQMKAFNEVSDFKLTEVQSPRNQELIERAIRRLRINGKTLTELAGLYNQDQLTDSQLISSFNPPASVLSIKTQKNYTGAFGEIKSNSTGSNSYSEYADVSVDTGMFFPKKVSQNFETSFGLKGEEFVDCFAADYLQQSIWRSSIRKDSEEIVNVWIKSLRVFRLICAKLGIKLKEEKTLNTAVEVDENFREIFSIQDLNTASIKGMFVESHEEENNDEVPAWFDDIPAGDYDTEYFEGVEYERNRTTIH